MLADTIAAISTAQGEAGIAIIRMSGPASVSIAEKILKSSSKNNNLNNNFKFKSPRVMSLAVLYLNNAPADYVLCVYFKAPSSFTGEDMVELHTHGGSLIAKLCLEELLKHGARLAEPGEFTKRAFLNNKIDLSQAESVLGIIKARSEEALKSAARVLSGELSNKILEIRDEILNIQGSIEIGLDFPEGEEPLINNLELLDTDSNYSNDDQLIDTSYASISTLENDSNNFINLGCQDSCCKNINVLNSDGSEDLLFEVITQIEGPEKRKEVLTKYKQQILDLQPQDIVSKMNLIY